jgi:hypothetical protein
VMVKLFIVSDLDSLDKFIMPKVIFKIYSLLLSNYNT